MPRVHHVKARKDHPEFGIAKGEMCYWWQCYRSPKIYSKTAPKASQLTRSEFLAAMADIEDEISALGADDGLESSVAEIAGRIRELGEEQEEKRGNMPEGLQEGDTGTMLQERADKCAEIADELEAITFDDDEAEAEGEDDKDEKESEWWQAKLDEVQAIDLSVS